MTAAVLVGTSAQKTRWKTLGVMYAFRQVATSGAVMAFDDVFRVTALVTLLAILPALFLQTKKSAPRGPRPIIAD